MFQTIAIHYPAPGHAEDFAAYMRRVREAVGVPPGLLSFDAWREPGDARLVAVSRWESADAFEAALPLIGSLRDERREEWSARPDDVITGSPL
jgi:heme-degrading monooxygenase HmoA